ncbi:MAG: hypothetical protein ABI678_27005 [Kofleriaceae bacterium]
MEDSPPDFIVIRTPHAMRGPTRLYEASLDLVEQVHLVLEGAVARFYLKDRIDKGATGIAMRLGRAQTEAASLRWRHYRDVLEQLVDVATLLDIVDRQQVTSELTALAAARALARRLMTEIRPLAGLGF